MGEFFDIIGRISQNFFNATRTASYPSKPKGLSFSFNAFSSQLIQLSKAVKSEIASDFYDKDQPTPISLH